MIEQGVDICGRDSNEWSEEQRANLTRHEITLYHSPFKWNTRPTMKLVRFDIAEYSGPKAKFKRKEIRYRLVAIFGVKDGPYPEDLIPPTKPGQRLTAVNLEARRDLRAAIREAICRVLEAEPEEIVDLDRVIDFQTTVVEGREMKYVRERPPETNRESVAP